jgi:hypothetical protein
MRVMQCNLDCRSHSAFSLRHINKHINTLCGRNVELLNVKTGNTGL